ncbi:bifunctional riboflavin kinase/FAD synthetase [Acuticoccus sp.]|uniref:bifunctional riboflavin kinase/FAD synthetase n=1 Tax=Acuticoccus sp. TaxID=1904378 RepID=UPI003B52A702
MDELPEVLCGGTVAIGNFDGVHRGHQAVLARALERLRPVVALTFEPHPRTFFSGRPLFRLTSAGEKARVIAALGLDATVVVPFDASLAALSAEAFMADVLAGRFGARAVVVGHDFSFGAKRRGDGAMLAREGPALGFATHVVRAFADDGVVSSTRIRDHLAEGDLGRAAALLGRRYAVTGEVVHGEKRGRQMGYPTANQGLAPANGLRHGIYAVRAMVDGTWHDGVASFGRRPTFDNGAPLLETFLFDWSGDLYGRTMRVALERFLRPELRFDGMDALMRQMDADSLDARAALADAAPMSDVDRALNF